VVEAKVKAGEISPENVVQGEDRARKLRLIN
jgi:hypothetical protein